MVENAGQLDIKVCGATGCCFVPHLDNGESNFNSGSTDRFEGQASLQQCDHFEVGHTKKSNYQET